MCLANPWMWRVQPNRKMSTLTLAYYIGCPNAVRAVNACFDSKLATLGQLMDFIERHGEDGLMQLPGIGAATVVAIMRLYSVFPK